MLIQILQSHNNTFTYNKVAANGKNHIDTTT